MRSSSCLITIVIDVGLVIFVILQGAIEVGGIARAWEIADDSGRIEFFEYVQVDNY